MAFAFRHFARILERSTAPHKRCALLRVTHAYRVLIGACNLDDARFAGPGQR